MKATASPGRKTISISTDGWKSSSRNISAVALNHGRKLPARLQRCDEYRKSTRARCHPCHPERSEGPHILSLGDILVVHPGWLERFFTSLRMTTRFVNRLSIAGLGFFLFTPLNAAEPQLSRNKAATGVHSTRGKSLASFAIC